MCPNCGGQRFDCKSQGSHLRIWRAVLGGFHRYALPADRDEGETEPVKAIVAEHP
jgi:muconolactone delta-isomerase